MPSVLFALVALLFAGVATAAPYRHPVWGISFSLPTGWQVRVHAPDAFRVLPLRQEDRERGGVVVVFSRQSLRGKEPLSRLAAGLRRADGAREAAQSIHLDRRSGRLAVSYREGQYVQNGLWIVSQRLTVWQQQGKGRYVRAECSANAAEYHRYRRAFADICLGFVAAGRSGGAS